MTTRPTGFRYLDALHEQPGTVLAFAHRGGAFHPEILGLENTLRAFRHAVELGYDYLETDVHVTRDGVLLAFHDSVLDRVTDASGAIAASTYAEVQRALINGSDPVPTLADLFDEFPEVRFNIDVKAPGAVEPLARFLEEREAWDRVCVGSFSGRRLPVSAGSREGGSRPRRPPARWRRTGCSPPPSPASSRVAARGSCRCRTSGAASRSSLPASSGGPTARACTFTSGPSTTPTR